MVKWKSFTGNSIKNFKKKKTHIAELFSVKLRSRGLPLFFCSYMKLTPLFRRVSYTNKQLVHKSCQLPIAVSITIGSTVIYGKILCREKKWAVHMIKQLVHKSCKVPVAVYITIGSTRDLRKDTLWRKEVSFIIYEQSIMAALMKRSITVNN